MTINRLAKALQRLLDRSNFPFGKKQKSSLEVIKDEISLLQVGEFQTDGVLIVSDPCYENSCLSIVCQAGTWNATINRLTRHSTYENREFREERIMDLTATSEAFDPNIPLIVEIVDHACVDSGQMGIIDSQTFGEEIEISQEAYVSLLKEAPTLVLERGRDRFYANCCHLTLSPKKAGILAGRGVVSATGWGDGIYPVRLFKQKGQVVAVNVTFIAAADL